MKLDVNKLFVVFKATPYSSAKDVFSGDSMTIQQFATKLKRGLDPNMIQGLYPSKRAAQIVANKLLKKRSNTPKTKVPKKKKVTKGFALFSNSVMAKDKYRINTPPTIIYATKKQAIAAIQRWEKEHDKKSNFKIMTYDSSKR